MGCIDHSSINKQMSYCKQYLSPLPSNTKLKITKGNNSKYNYARVIILVHDTSSHHTELIFEVSAQLGHGCKRYAPDKKLS